MLLHLKRSCVLLLKRAGFNRKEVTGVMATNSSGDFESKSLLLHNPAEVDRFTNRDRLQRTQAQGL